MEKCQFYISQKKRTCNQLARSGCKYCGNHLPSEAGEKSRVPCPYDASHTILHSDLEAHKFKCPFLQQQKRDQSNPYFREDCNAGCVPPADLSLVGSQEGTEHGESVGGEYKKTRAQQLAARTAERLAYAHALGPDALLALIQRIEQAFSQVCSSEDLLKEVVPAAAQSFLAPDRVRPFSMKHALQQASIVGNMGRVGLLQDTQERVFVEFGAGKGYLSSMLQDCCPARNLVLMDRDSFRLKADRSLRQAEEVQMERIRVDIKDFHPPGLPQLRSGQAPWVALGKHLCGAATDFTLRCCANALASSKPQGADQCSPCGAAEEPTANGRVSRDASVTGEATHIQGGDGCSTCGAAEEPTANGWFSRGASWTEGPSRIQEGDRCSPCGATEEPTANGWVSRDASVTRGVSGIQGLAVATCCHHRCAWEHYVGQALFQRLRFSPAEFEMISWMTGWALCGHEAPSREAGPDTLPKDDSLADGTPEQPEQSCISATRQSGITRPTVKRKGGGKKRKEASERRKTVIKAATHCEQLQMDTGAVGSVEDAAGSSIPAGKPPDGWAKSAAAQDDCMEFSSASTRWDQAIGQEHSEEAAQGEEGKGASAVGPMTGCGDGIEALRVGGPRNAAAPIPRIRRIQVGQMCKRLIDHGRLEFLQEQGYDAQLVLYVPSVVSGENRLLLAVPAWV